MIATATGTLTTIIIITRTAAAAAATTCINRPHNDHANVNDNSNNINQRPPAGGGVGAGVEDQALGVHVGRRRHPVAHLRSAHRTFAQWSPIDVRIFFEDFFTLADGGTR